MIFMTHCRRDGAGRLPQIWDGRIWKSIPSWQAILGRYSVDKTPTLCSAAESID